MSPISRFWRRRFQDELTVLQAADVLGFSERHVNGLLDVGRIEFRTSSDGRMILRDSLLAYVRWIRDANESVDEMSEEMGVYDTRAD